MYVYIFYAYYYWTLHIPVDVHSSFVCSVLWWSWLCQRCALLIRMCRLYFSCWEFFLQRIQQESITPVCQSLICILELLNFANIIHTLQTGEACVHRTTRRTGAQGAFPDKHEDSGVRPRRWLHGASGEVCGLLGCRCGQRVQVRTVLYGCV